MKTAKVKTKFVCSECGYETPKYLGKCPDCGSWGTLVEEKIAVAVPKSSSAKVSPSEYSKTLLLKDTELNSNNERFATGNGEFDRVTGGGLVDGSVILIAGDPGIGKSTLVLQIAEIMSKKGKKVFYVCAEESPSQVKLRAERLGVKGENLYLCPQIDTEKIREEILRINPDVVIADSIQAVYSPEISSSSGSVSQIRECADVFTQIAKSKNITTIIIGHVTKDGNIAGPRVLEHTVDAVFRFEGDKNKTFRMLRSIKNRFGCTNEVGIFKMEENGLAEVTNPGEVFLRERGVSSSPGTTITASCEGSRVLTVEVQALVGQTSYPSPRRVAVGFDYNRLLQIIAVIEKRIGLNLSKSDVYVNIAGGLEVNEPSADCGVALAIISSARDFVVPNDTVIAGEICLTGEVGKIVNPEKLVKEAEKTGFKRIIVPAGNLSKGSKSEIETVEVALLSDVLCALRATKT